MIPGITRSGLIFAYGIFHNIVKKKSGVFLLDGCLMVVAWSVFRIPGISPYGEKNVSGKGVDKGRLPGILRT